MRLRDPPRLGGAPRLGVKPALGVRNAPADCQEDELQGRQRTDERGCRLFPCPCPCPCLFLSPVPLSLGGAGPGGRPTAAEGARERDGVVRVFVLDGVGVHGETEVGEPAQWLEGAAQLGLTESVVST